MATQLVLKLGSGIGPHVHIHKLDRAWDLRLSGLGPDGSATLHGQLFTKDGVYPIEVRRQMQLNAIDVTSAFSAVLLMR